MYLCALVGEVASRKYIPLKSLIHGLWPGNNEWEGSHDTAAFEQIIPGLGGHELPGATV